MTAVTFDYGQTLAELDTTFLARRVAERQATVSPHALDRASPVAWRAYDDAKRRGETGHDAWTTFMRTLLSAGEVTGSGPGATADALSEWLWEQQPEENLWRRPIPGMLELCTELAHKRVALGIVSNSEGRLVELLSKMGLGELFPVVADSGVLGFEKPDPRIFEWTAERLGVPTSETIHVGDAYVADVEGALGVSARAIWITHDAGARRLPDSVIACSTAAEVRVALSAWGVP